MSRLYVDYTVDKDGHLSIRRNKGYKVQYCCRAPHKIPCGNWCPLFSNTLYDCMGRERLELCSGQVLLKDCKEKFD